MVMVVMVVAVLVVLMVMVLVIVILVEVVLMVVVLSWKYSKRFEAIGRHCCGFVGGGNCYRGLGIGQWTWCKSSSYRNHDCCHHNFHCGGHVVGGGRHLHLRSHNGPMRVSRRSVDALKNVAL